MAKVILFSLLSVLACVSAQRITTIHLDGVQYFISRMNPYSPELNYFLAYQYCRSLGLQLASFETKEKSESMTTYLKNAGYGNYDFWTSGNRLGTGMFLWMSTGLPFNATFDFFENSGDALQTSLLDANDHNSNTAPQRTARDSSSGSEKGCVILKQPSLKWMPEDCSAVKDFICEQTRCYYYNYGSIPVSSAQGRPITSTTPQPKQQPTVTEITLRNTTPLPILMSTYAYEKKLASINNNNLPQQQQQQQPPQQQQDQQHHARKEIDIEEDESQPSFMSLNLDHEGKKLNQEHEQAFGGEVDADGEDETVVEDEEHDDNVAEESDEMTAHIVGQDHEQEKARELKKNHEHKISADDTIATGLNSEHQQNQEQLANHAEEVEEEKNSAKMDASKLSAIDNNIKSHEVDEHVAQISHKIEKIVSNEQMYPLHHHAHAHFHRQDSNNESNNHDNNSNDDDVNDGNDDDSSLQSFLSLTDLIRTLRPNDKQIIPQIDSDYSNAMRVLGENTGPLMKRDEQQPRGNNNFRDNLDFSTH